MKKGISSSLMTWDSGAEFSARIKVENAGFNKAFHQIQAPERSSRMVAKKSCT
jgi:hypothetical protein